MAQDIAQDVAKDVSGIAEDGSVKALTWPIARAAEDGGLKVLITARIAFQRRNPRPTHAYRPPSFPLGDT